MKNNCDFFSAKINKYKYKSIYCDDAIGECVVYVCLNSSVCGLVAIFFSRAPTGRKDRALLIVFTPMINSTYGCLESKCNNKALLINW